MDWNLAGAVILSGLVIVFALLTILIGVVTVTGKVLNKDAMKPKPAQSVAPAPSVSTPPPPVKVAAPVVQSGISEQTVAVISAAVAAVMDEQSPGTVYTVASIQKSRQTRPVWGFAGMQQNTRPF